VGDHSHVLSGQKSLHRQSSVSRLTVMVKQQVTVPDVFGGLAPQTLQNLRAIMLVHRLAWRNKFLVNNALTVKKDHQHAVDVRPSTFESRELLYSPHGIVTESCFEHLKIFRCCFPESESKFHANALFFQISHYTYNRKSRIALNTHKNKHSLRSNTKSYGGNTHKIAIQLHLVAESCTICNSSSRRPVRKLFDTPS
jgi:hypothetical protein